MLPPNTPNFTPCKLQFSQNKVDVQLPHEEYMLHKLSNVTISGVETSLSRCEGEH